jgi:hypothetical protein
MKKSGSQIKTFWDLRFASRKIFSQKLPKFLRLRSGQVTGNFLATEHTETTEILDTDLFRIA